MIPNNRFCTYVGHDQYLATHLCVSQGCKLEQRWCCVQCITQGVHNHGQQGFTHLIPWKDVIFKKKEELLKLQQDHQNCLQQCIELLKFIKDYQAFIEQQINKIQKTKEGLQHFIDDLSEQTIVQLNNQRLYEVISINHSQLLNDQVLKIQSYQSVYQRLKGLIKELQDQGMAFNNTNDLKQVKYKIKEIDQFECQYWPSQISDNSKYLAYCNYRLLKIYDIQKDKIIREIQLDVQIHAIQFTFDSSQLYVGCQLGYVFGFDVSNDFKLIFRSQINQDDIFHIRTIQNQCLITHSDQTIIKTDIATKQQLFKLVSDSCNFSAIDCNEIDNILISGLYDGSIKLWDCKNKSILINQQKSHLTQVNQIQLINIQNVLSLDNHFLYKWRIDLRKKLLIKIQEFKDPNGIFYFYQINQNQNLILICGEYVKILNNKAETINQIDYKAGYFHNKHQDCRQVDDGKLIQIRSGDKIMLAIAQN